MNTLNFKKIMISFTENSKESIATTGVVRTSPTTYTTGSLLIKSDNPVGTLLQNFVSDYDFNCFDSFKKFTDTWGLSGLYDVSQTCRQIFTSRQTYNTLDLESVLISIHSEVKSYLSTTQYLFEKALYLCVDSEGPEWSHGLANIKRYYLLCKFMDFFEFQQFQDYNQHIDTSFTVNTSNQAFDENFILNTLDETALIQYAKALADEEFSVSEVICSFNIGSILYAEFKEVIVNNIHMKKCKNCNKYFASSKRLNVEYCDRAVKKNSNGTIRTCKDIGPVKFYESKLSNDPLNEAYRKVYKKIHARLTAGKMTNDEFLEWKITAHEKMELVRSNNNDIEEFIEWIKSN